MKRLRILILLLACTLFVGNIPVIPVMAGLETIVSSPTLEDSELNLTDWYFTDSNIVNEDGNVVISPETSSDTTKFIGKNVSVRNEAVEVMTAVEAKLQITGMPKEEQLVMAFGLSSIEASLGETGNVEISFINDGGIKVRVVTYTENGEQTLVNARACGVSLDKEFSFRANITTEGVLNVEINSQSICQKTLPTSGEGRFGILQSGKCGVKIASLDYSCNSYATPENTNIVEDFESGDFNANLFYSTSTANGLYPSAFRIEERNGSKMLRFENLGLSYFGTLHKYSNFEISFDMPYFLRENLYDDKGVLTNKPSSNIGVSFGSEQQKPKGWGYTYDIDLITLRSDVVRSERAELWSASLTDIGVTDTSTNEGYSFKFTVIDGHSVCQVKALSATEWLTVGEADYDLQRSGYIYIWSTGNADCAIDNLKITNLDENPKLIEVERKSSIITAEDYEITDDEKKMVFRPNDSEKEESYFDTKIFIVCCASVSIILIGIGLAVNSILKKRSRKRVKSDDKK